MKENSIEEDMKILEGIIKGDEDCINAIYSQMKVKNDNDEDIQYYKKEIQSIKNIVDNYLKEKARADKLEKEYSAMLTESDENECDYKRVLKENEKLRQERELVGLSVRNKRDGTIGIILHQWESGSIAVLENIKPRVINTHDNWNTLEIINDNVEQKRTENNYIPIKKVKDKIEELKKKVEELTDEKGYWGGSDLLEQIKVLQELLEKEK